MVLRRKQSSPVTPSMVGSTTLLSFILQML
nr:MAG TPA: hypothetical protein [Caudoviricetes sp.]